MARMFDSRHSLNFLSGVFTCWHVLRMWHDCNTLLRNCTTVVFFTTVAFHGLHVLGHEQLANRIVMKYDVAAVISSGIALLVMCPAAQQLFVFATLAVTFIAWLLTFGSHPLPFNASASVIHLIGYVLNYKVSRVMCTT